MYPFLLKSNSRHHTEAKEFKEITAYQQKSKEQKNASPQTFLNIGWGLHHSL